MNYHLELQRLSKNDPRGYIVLLDRLGLRYPDHTDPISFKRMNNHTDHPAFQGRIGTSFPRSWIYWYLVVSEQLSVTVMHTDPKGREGRQDPWRVSICFFDDRYWLDYLRYSTPPYIYTLEAFGKTFSSAMKTFELRLGIPHFKHWMLQDVPPKLKDQL